MDPVTHALTCVALDRAGLRRVSRQALPILVASGVAADLDLLSYFGGAASYLRLHDTLLHSLLGSTIVALAVAFAFWLPGRRNAKSPLRFRPVLLLSAIGAAAHLILDLASFGGVRLLWPFSGRWFAWDFVSDLDLWILAILLIGLLLPGLFRMVSEEIGAKKKGQAPSKMAIAALALVALYVGLRADMHQAAVQALLSRDYHGRVPLLAGAFPDSTSPFSWRGVVDTQNTIETLEVDVGPEASLDPEASLTHFKPDNSQVLEAARRSPVARSFLAYAQFPLAEAEDLDSGYRVTLRDMRFPAQSDAAGNMIAIIELDQQLRVRDERLEFTR
ncbi:MAG TPA: metal-dependent hydrolase [Candidatus Acidoferrales bacterium]|nr:metal-dependent hydrolase [Candidatus Acidoferrales bacterium]